ncbi:uncharacterized mitochondrial protein-like protein, partial [Tanacetum coccineum]
IVDHPDNEITSDSNIIPYSQYPQETQHAETKTVNESLTAEHERYKERVKTFEQGLNVDLSSREKLIDSQMDDMIRNRNALKQEIELNEVKTVFNQMKAAVEQCSVDKKYFDIQKKELSLDNDRLLDHIICQDVLNIVMHVDSVHVNVWKPIGRTFTIDENTCPLTRITSTKVVTLKETTSKSVITQNPKVKVYCMRPKVTKSVGSSSKYKIIESRISNNSESNQSWGSNASDVPSSSSPVDFRFENDQIAKIMGYGDYQMGNLMISWVYYVEGLGHNLFSVGQFCDSDLEVAFRKYTCYIRDLEGVDLLKGSRGLNLYTLSLEDMMKIKKHSHKPKAEDSIQEKLYLLHMDLCGPMRIQSINGWKYILVIVDDYSRFTWAKFLRSKDEVTEFFRTRASTPDPGIIRSGLVPNPPSPTPYVPPTKKDYDILFQPMFDKYFSPPPSVASPVLAVIALVPANLTEEFHDIKVAHLDNDPSFGVPIPEPNSKESSSRDVIPTNVYSINQPPEHINQDNLNHVYKLNKALYGLKQAPRAWYDYSLEKKAKIPYCNPVDTPMVEKSKLDVDLQGKDVDHTCYHGMIGSLKYLTASRPGLVFAVCMRDSCIALTAFADANHAGCQDTRRSTITPPFLHIAAEANLGCFTKANGSKPRSNTKKDRITQTLSSNKKKNKVEDHPRIAKSSLSNKNRVIEPVETYRTDLHYRWKHVPLTRITSTKIEPLKETTSKSVTTPNPEFKIYSKKTKVAKSVDLSSEPSILGSRPSNISEPNKHWGSTVSKSSSSSLVNIRFGNDQIAKIMGYGDYQMGNVMIS